MNEIIAITANIKEVIPSKRGHIRRITPNINKDMISTKTPIKKFLRVSTLHLFYLSPRSEIRDCT